MAKKDNKDNSANHAGGTEGARRATGVTPAVVESVHDSDIDKCLTFITNQFTLPAITIADFYRYRWQIEPFFKWIKQYFRIKALFGTSESPVKTQIWIAIKVVIYSLK